MAPEAEDSEAAAHWAQVAVVAAVRVRVVGAARAPDWLAEVVSAADSAVVVMVVADSVVVVMEAAAAAAEMVEAEMAEEASAEAGVVVAEPAAEAAATAIMAHLIAHALGETAAVRWVTRTFAARLRRFVVEGAALNGSSASVALMRAFTAASCGPHNTGYVGASLPAIETALASGNLREVWALVYVMSKSRYFTHLLLALLTPRGSGVLAVPPRTPATLAARLGMDAAELSARHELVVATQRTH
eukprot:jgi/Chrpa1/25143/Chrysochromulina_OHIO_Genome00026023-RA